MKDSVRPPSSQLIHPVSRLGEASLSWLIHSDSRLGEAPLTQLIHLVSRLAETPPVASSSTQCQWWVRPPLASSSTWFQGWARPPLASSSTWFQGRVRPPLAGSSTRCQDWVMPPSSWLIHPVSRLGEPLLSFSLPLQPAHPPGVKTEWGPPLDSWSPSVETGWGPPSYLIGWGPPSYLIHPVSKQSEAHLVAASTLRQDWVRPTEKLNTEHLLFKQNKAVLVHPFGRIALDKWQTIILIWKWWQ